LVACCRLLLSVLSCLSARSPPRSTVFPYTTLFRSFFQEQPYGLPNAKVVVPLGTLVCWYNVGKNTHSVSGGPWSDSGPLTRTGKDRKSTRLNSCHQIISYAVFCLKTKKQQQTEPPH